VTVPWLRGYREETIAVGRRYDPETLGRDGLGLLDAIDVPRAVLVGHDWGALIAYVAAALAPERVRAIVTLGIPHPAVLERTPAAFWAVRHFLGLKLPWAPWVCRRNDFAYLDKLYRRWAPSWSGAEREQTLSRAKQALSSPATLDGAISYYRDLPLGSPPPVTAHVPSVLGLVIGGTADLADAELFTRTAELLAQPSRALIVAGAGHWPHRENPTLVVPALLEYLAELGASA
jgi:pimeloyl-ACP methyl ester carboxylesterase